MFAQQLRRWHFRQSGCPGNAFSYFKCLEHTDARLWDLSRARYDLLNLHPRDQVLDLGCGPGEDSRELAYLVAPARQGNRD